MTENSAVPPDWVGKRVELTIAGSPSDTRAITRLVAVGSDGLRVEEQGTQRFVPWHAIRQLRASTSPV